MTDSNIILVRYALTLSPEGQCKSAVDHIAPDKIRASAGDWEDAELFAKAISFVAKRLEELDSDLEKYMQSL